MTEATYRVNVEHVFEGPMDLLVHLIKKNDLDICDIPIALITEQFIEYLEWMKEMNIDVAADFLVMAATLTQIKSRMLLPVENDEEDEEDPRERITGPLREYIRMKSAAKLLAERPVLDEDVFARLFPENKIIPIAERPLDCDLSGLVCAYVNVLERSAPDIRLNFEKERISIREKMRQVIDILEEKGAVTFDELVSGVAEKAEIIATFLAILEVVRLDLAMIRQRGFNGSIRIVAC